MKIDSKIYLMILITELILSGRPDDTGRAQAVRHNQLARVSLIHSLISSVFPLTTRSLRLTSSSSRLVLSSARRRTLLLPCVPSTRAAG
jgi:hypothetical protein